MSLTGGPVWRLERRRATGSGAGSGAVEAGSAGGGATGGRGGCGVDEFGTGGKTGAGEDSDTGAKSGGLERGEVILGGGPWVLGRREYC